jgi:DNA-binding response OmpR family regulator
MPAKLGTCRHPNISDYGLFSKVGYAVGQNDTGTILIVEDDEAFSYAASHYLKSKGYNVIVASGSLAALRELDNEQIDVVVADIALQPNEPHGLSLGRMIVTQKPAVPVLFVTGRPDLIELDGHAPGDVLYKPVDFDALAHKIDELLRKH